MVVEKTSIAFKLKKAVPGTTPIVSKRPILLVTHSALILRGTIY
jgi:hypothetical protein